MEIVFLGTASRLPTKERNPSSFLISYENEGVLVDCGEGTQRQMKLKGIKLTKVTKILISHWHGDHVLGLPGLMMSLCASDYRKTLEIYGPKGTKKYFESLTNAFVFSKQIDIKIKEVASGRFFEDENFVLEAHKLDHGVPSLGFNFIEKDKRKIQMEKVRKLGLKEGSWLGEIQRGKKVSIDGRKINPEKISKLKKGKKISVLTDTKLCNNCYKLAKGADVLISEATFSSEHEEKSEEYKHMTAKQAAQIAKKAKVKKLVLTHFSARYKTTKDIEKEAKSVFRNVVCAKDFMKIKL